MIWFFPVRARRPLALKDELAMPLGGAQVPSARASGGVDSTTYQDQAQKPLGLEEPSRA
jgi:hypothetical protein